MDVLIRIFKEQSFRRHIEIYPENFLYTHINLLPLPQNVVKGQNVLCFYHGGKNFLAMRVFCVH